MVVFMGSSELADVMDSQDRDQSCVGSDVLMDGFLMLGYMVPDNDWLLPACRLWFDPYQRGYRDGRLSARYADAFLSVPSKIDVDVYESYVGSDEYRELMLDYYGQIGEGDWDDEEDDEGVDADDVEWEWRYTSCRAVELLDVYAHGVVDDWMPLQTVGWWGRRYVCAPRVRVDFSGDYEDLEMDVWNRLWLLSGDECLLSYPGDGVVVSAASSVEVYLFVSGLVRAVLG